MFTALWLISLALFSLLWVNLPARAQETPPDAPIYVVQQGDTAWGIARRFGITVDDLTAANDLVNAGQLYEGQELIIPGLEGVQGYLQTRRVAWGESARSLSRKYELPPDVFMHLNRLTSPAQLYVGGSVILPVQDLPTPLGRRVDLGVGETPVEAAAAYGVSPWEMTFLGGAASPGVILPGDVLLLPGESDGPAALPPEVTALRIGTPLVQGRTLTVSLKGAAQMQIEADFLGRALHFFPDAQRNVALQGIPALQPPGLYPLSMAITLPDGQKYTFEQEVPVFEGDYLYDPPLTVPADVLDPAVTGPEDEQLRALTAPVSSEKHWQGMFSPPVDAAYVDCWPSRYGNRRSYNDSGYIYFHTGLDFCGQVGHPIYAAARGTVVFTGETRVRGNMTVIDHGWGVYTVYMHQSEIDVQAGETVTAGQLIGKVGATGRVTGPHLHFEVWVNGVQVDPWLWLTGVYP